MNFCANQFSISENAKFAFSHRKVFAKLTVCTVHTDIAKTLRFGKESFAFGGQFPRNVNQLVKENLIVLCGVQIQISDLRLEG
jgi:hypothetical protein